ncbi:hypothetical protein [Vibrio genomosp. F10]|uniref:hypothetical protein n=1 Tax=Vibrio genomosp. F10 TaxID=723171 RepID=UPI0003715ABA|nr:hypothetical protein [Vibrio genomosp. F10]OEF07909.1 hypothetical protein A1QK_06725 [Vibrio genomosp. F10 str. 9ZD137]
MELELQNWLAPLLTIVGWGFLLFNADRIATRTEARSLCDKCVDKLEELIKYVNEQHLTTQKNQDDEYNFQEKVNIYLFSVETKTKYLKARTSYTFLEPKKLASLRRLSSDPIKSDDIIELSRELIESIEVQYSNYFAGGWFKRLKPLYFPITITFWITVWVTLVFAIGSLFGVPLPNS